jgi:hypothetical protein
MLTRHDGDHTVCIGQASHAWVSGQLARRWGNDRFPRPEPFDEVCLGAEQHDVGMAEWDLTPTLDRDTGGPTTFLRMPLATHLELWSAAPSKVLTQSPYAALLVSMHGHALYARRDTTEPDSDDSRAVARFVAEQEAFQRDLLEHLGEDPARARANQKLVWALDFMSLAPVMGWFPEDVPAPDGTPIAVRPAGEQVFTADPWPFGADEFSVRYQGRRLDRPAESQKELHEALAAAPWVTVEVRWVRRAG